MFTTADARQLLDEVFEQEALVIGGLAATGGVEDDLVWRLVRNLDALRRKALRSLEEKEESLAGEERSVEFNPNPHPAIEEFLLKIRRS